MAIDTKGVPPSVAAVTVPQPDPKPGLAMTWKFTSGETYSLTVEADKIERHANGWVMTTQDGREVTVYSVHVMAWESKEVTIRPRKLTSDG